MKIKFLFLTFILLNYLTSTFAQQIIVTGDVSSIVCRGNIISVPFTKTGTFESANIFTVQIKSSTEKKWINLVTQGTESPLKVTIPANYDSSSYNNSTSYYIRVIASKPNIIGKESFIPTIYSKSQISLVGATLTTVNPYGSTTLKFRGSGSTPIQIVLSDSSKVSIPYSISPNSDYYSGSTTSIFPLKSGNYTIAYSENMCGRSDGTGSVAIAVNEIGLKALRPENTAVCVGGVLRIPYSTNGRKMNVDNKFKVGFKYTNVNLPEIELEAIEKNGFVEVIIPENFKTQLNYSTRLISSSPTAKSEWTVNSNDYVFVGDKPSVDITPINRSVEWGQRFDLVVRLSGVAPWNVTLNDGTIIYNINIPYSEGEPDKHFYTIRPQKSTTYSIASFSNGCGFGSVSKNEVNVILKPGIVVDSLPEVELCVGESFKAKYSIKGEVNLSNLSTILKGRDSNYTVNVPSTFENGIVKVTIPTTFFSDASYADVEYELGVKYNDLIFYSNYYKFVKIRNKPNAVFANANLINLGSKGIANLPMLVTGITPLTIQLDDLSNFTVKGNNSNYDKNPTQFPVQVIKSSTFSIKSVSNSCGTTLLNDGKIMTVIVKNKASFGISIKNADTQACAGNKIKVNFNTLGEFGFDNNYKIELFKYNYDRIDNVAVTIGSGKSSPIEAIIPNDYVANEYAYLRVSSSNPTVASELKQISINTKPVVSPAYGYYFTAITLLAGGSISASGNLLEGLPGSTLYKFSDGTVISEKPNSSYTPAYAAYNPEFTQSTIFSLNSVSNECGEGTVLSRSVKITVVPFKILHLSSSFNGTTVCTDRNLSYRYGFAGKPEKGVQYNLQIASVKDSIFSDIGSKTTENPVIAKIPKEIKPGNYFIRLVSNTNPMVSSDWEKVTIDSPLVVSVATFDNNNTITVEEGNPVTLKYNYSNKSAPSFITISDEFNNIYTSKLYDLDNSNGSTQIIYPKRTSTFTIKSVENACGFGIGSGSVKIITTPTLIIQKPNSNIICVGGDLKLKYSTTGNYPADNTFKFLLTYTGYEDNIQKTIKYELGQTTALSGEITLKIPSDIPLRYYQLEVLSSNPNSRKIYEDISFYVSRIPDATVSGSTTINAGSGTCLNIINGVPGWYILSDSTQGKLYYSKICVSVSPSKTTTYKILSVYNECGIGKSSGSATITVNPISDKKVYSDFEEYSKFPEQYPYICSGAAYTIKYNTIGEFSQTNKFTVQVSDENGENFKDVITEAG